jgi:hypothetical protein
MALYGSGSAFRKEVLLFGIPVGIALSSLLVIVYLFFAPWDIVRIASLIILVGVIPLRFVRGKCAQITPVSWTKTDRQSLYLFLTFLCLSITIPLLSVGRYTDKGFAYASLFGHDFLLRVSFSASIARGVPPPYFHYSGFPLPTYWLFYTLPAFVYKTSESSFSLTRIMLINTVFQSILFTAVIYYFLCNVVRTRRAKTTSMVVCLSAYSYYDAYFLFKYFLEKFPDMFVAVAGRAGLSKFGDLSHSIYRAFLMEPQAVLSLTLLMWFILLINPKKNPSRGIPSQLFAGVILGLILGIDAFIGVVVHSWYLALAAIAFFTENERTIQKTVKLMIPFLGSIVVFIIYTFVGMYTRNVTHNSLMIQPYWMIILLFPLYSILEYGPAFLFSVCALYLKRHELKEYMGLLSLLIIVFFFALFVRHTIEINLGLRKGAYILYVPMILLTGIFFDKCEGFQKTLRYAILLVIALGIPTLGTDIYAASRIHDPRNTTYVSRPDYEASLWIKNNTPRNAIVQCEPEYPGPYEYSLIACFAEREMVIGESKSALFVPLANIKELADKRKEDVRDIFRLEDTECAIRNIRKYGIDYIYVGLYEKSLYPLGVNKFEKNLSVFRKVYDRENVQIYLVEKGISSESVE